MLQQTQVATAVRYFERFVTRFPDVLALADAPLDAVLHLWSGLGYYARARNLHRAARVIRDEHGGEFPRDFDVVVDLPGIGLSTAGAILALARDERHAILDGNVKRVLARWFAVPGFPGSTRTARELWRLSEAVMPSTNAADFTQAIMDLGATLCTRANPACERCPVGADCRARAMGKTAEYPATRAQRARPRREVVWLVLKREGAYLLEQRPPAGIWGGLWGFPEFANRELAESALRAAGAHANALSGHEATIKHAFSHFDLEITPLVAEVVTDAAHVMEGPAQTWYNSRAPASLGLAAPVATLLRELENDDKPSPTS
jgi:A/G-specific adenine glycosylase